MTSPRPLLQAAMTAGGWTLERLRDRSGLGITVSSISRKLSGLQGITIDEADRLARVMGVTLPGVDECKEIERRLGVTVLWLPERRRASS